jgi:hypothetical protein
VSTLIERVEATAAQGLVDRFTWDALPHLLAVCRAAYQEHELDRRSGEPCPGCPVCAVLDASPLFREVWADNDPRAEGRSLRVLRVENGGAVCEEGP